MGAIVGFTHHNRLIGVLMPSQTVYTTDLEMMSRTGYGMAYKQSNDMLLNNIADSITQTVELTNLLQCEAYENQ